MKMKFVRIVLILSFYCLKSIVTEEESLSNISDNEMKDNNMIVLNLDDNTNRMLFDLFVDVFGNNPNNKVEIPVSTVAQLYRNYTQEQLDSLNAELKHLDNRFDIVRKRVGVLQERFLVSNIEYALKKNLTNYEKSFVQIGEQLVTLQKIILKLTNADIPIDENIIKSLRNGRKSLIATIFDRLAGLLLGVNTEQNNYQNSEPLNPKRLNKIISLIKALRSVRNLDSNQLNPKMQTDLLKLQTMLYRLQQIQLLNRLAEERKFLGSTNMNPYGYEAILNLVKLVGTSSGQNQLRALMRLFTAIPQTNNNNNKNTNNNNMNMNMSQDKLKSLMKVIEDQEKSRRQQQENQRQKELLNELLMNQRRQQNQIDSLIQLIEKQNKHKNNNQINNNNNYEQNNNNEDIWSMTTTTTTKRPTTHRPTTSNHDEILSKLREQRRQLNNLLKTLGTDFNNNRPNSQVPSSGAQNNKNKNVGNTNPNSNTQTQDAFTNILKSMAPMIGTLAQSGLITPSQNQMTKNSLSELLNQKPFNDYIQYDSYKSKASKFIDLLGSIFNF